MLCTNCTKLAKLHTNKTCLRCKGAISINISVLCDKCSDNSNQCSVCLKNISKNNTKSNGCGQCGK